MSFAGDRPIVLVTAGAKRVGRAISERFAADKCDVLLTYNTSKDDAHALCDELCTKGIHAEAHPLDLRDADATLQFASSCAQSLPRLDVLVHNASIYQEIPIASVTASDALLQYQVNALAPLLLSKGLAPLLRRTTELHHTAPTASRTSIVAMLDIHAIGRPRAHYSAYAMSKAALHEMVRTLAKELAPHIRVNAVAPGVVAFPETGPESDPAMQDRYLARVPLNRAGTPEEAAEAVAWLALGARYTTGQTIRVDGGRWIG